MTTVGLVYGYSPRNAGDFAITLGAIDVLMHHNYRIKLFSRYCKANKDYDDSLKLLRQRYGDDIEVFESPFNLDRKDNALRTLVSYADGALSVLGLKRNAKFREELLSCDAVFFNGGNLFRCNSLIDYTRLKALMYPLRIVKNDRPFVILPQSASLLNRLGKCELLPVLKKANMVFFREEESYNYLSGLMDNSRFMLTIDMAFFINKDNLKINDRYSGRIALTLRYHTVGDITLFTEDRIDKIYNIYSGIIRKYENEKFVIVVQCEKDRLLSRKLAEEFDVEIIEENDPIKLLAIYKGTKALIGMRLHSIILALSVGTPCYGIFYKEWGLKNPGLMKRFEMPYSMLDNSDDIDYTQIDRILTNKNRISGYLADEIGKEYSRLDMKKALAKFTPPNLR